MLVHNFCCTQSSKLLNSIPQGKVEILEFPIGEESGRSQAIKISKQLFCIHVVMWQGGLVPANLGKLDVL